MGNLSWKAIVAALVAAMGIGFLWYGVLFQDQWMAGNGLTLDGDVMSKNGVPQVTSSMPMIINTIVAVLYAIFLNWLINKTGDYGWKKGGTLGFIIGLIMLLGIWVGNLFASNPLSLTMVDGSYSLVMWTVMGMIVGALSNKK